MTSGQIEPDDVRFFSGQSNIPLAEGITTHLGVPLARTQFQRFTNDNMRIQLCASVRGRKVYIVQSLVPPVSDNLMELLMMIDIARAAAAKEVHAIIPYFSYARSDKKDAPRISITARLIADLLVTAGATHVMTMQLHSPQVHGFFSVPTDPLTARGRIVEYILDSRTDLSNAIVVAPDAGIGKSAARFASHLGLPTAVASKTRVSDTRVEIGETLQRQVQGFRSALIYDDEIATGGSVIELSNLLIESGVEKIRTICTHGLFLGRARERLAAIPQITEIITTDTVYLAPHERLPNMTILSVADVFGEAIRRNYLHESIGDLFTYWDE
ncbi:MAG: ribose-phosphate pyrophosphokinase [Caldilineales bacterium]|nr:ribose-phosphate pyrophosphokinase [Caldilineales bacterium]